MSRKSTWCKFLAILLVMVLLVPILAACGDDNKEETPTPAATTPAATKPVATTPAAMTPAKTTPAVTTPAAITPTKTASGKPVKIGAIQDWSGPGAQAGWMADGMIKYMEWLVNEKNGGILGGRPIEFVKYDMAGQVAKASSGAEKLITQDKVIAIIMGGWEDSQGFPIAEATDKAHMLYANFFSDPKLFTDFKYTLSGHVNADEKSAFAGALIVDVLKPKTVAFFGEESLMSRDQIAGVKRIVEAAGVKTVYDQYYSRGAADLAPYLTRIKYANPDLLVTCLGSKEIYNNMFKQIMGLGGWGDIKHIALREHAVISDIPGTPGIEGSYLPTIYLPGMPSAGAKAFEANWAAKFKEDSAWGTKYSLGSPVPIAPYSFFENNIMAVIAAIKLAGTDDPAAVADAALSGRLEYDSSFGHVVVGTNGFTNVGGIYLQVQKGQPVPVWKWIDGKLVPYK